MVALCRSQGSGHQSSVVPKNEENIGITGVNSASCEVHAFGIVLYTGFTQLKYHTSPIKTSTFALYATAVAYTPNMDSRFIGPAIRE